MADVLVVDDHPFNLSLIRQQLDLIGIACDVAVGTAEALRLWDAQPYLLVITDCHMGSSSGFDLARQLRERERQRALLPRPILAWTADNSASNHAACLAAGMNDVLLKPTLLGPLRQSLEHWLGQVLSPRGVPSAQMSALAAGMATAAPDRPHGAPSGADPLPVLDLAALAEFTGNDRATEIEIFAEFREAHRRDRKQFDAHHAARDAAAAGLIAHRMKGACRILGAQALGAVLQRLEVAAKAGDWPAVEALLDPLRRETTRLLMTIEQRIG